MRVLDRENYQLRQAAGGASSFDHTRTKSSNSEYMSESAKAKYEDKIQALEAKILKVQEGKLDNTEQMLELTQENQKLNTTSRELTKKCLDL